MEALGIDWKILIIQIVNFLILFLILKWVLYKPIVKLLDDRKNKIKIALENAEKSQKQFKEAQVKIHEELAKAKNDAKEIIALAAKQAEDIKQKNLAESKIESEELLQKAETRILEQKESMKKELQAEIATIATKISEKVIKENLTSEINERIIDESIDKL